MELTLDQALQKGVEAHKAGKFQEADRYYTAILKANPKNPDANHNMGVLAIGLGKLEAALPFFKTALEANQTIVQFWLSYIDALIKLNRIDDAKAVLDQAKSKGGKGDGFDQLESRLANMANSDGSQTNEEILKQAIDLRENGKYDEAINLLLHQTKQSFTNPNILALLSHCYILNDNLEKAKIYLSEAKNINPKMASVSWNESRLLLKQKKIDEALAIAKTTNKLFPDDIEGMGVLGSCLRANSNFDKSLKYLNKAIELNPDYSEALINRALVSLAQDDKVSALSDLGKAHHLKPHIKQIWHPILTLKMEIKELEDTISLAEKMVKLDPRDEKIFAIMALCHLHLHNYDDSVGFYNKAISLKPDYIEAWTNLGVTFKQQGKLEEAIEAYKKALSIKPDYADAFSNMGNALQEQGKLEEAIEAYNKALSLRPDIAEVYNNLGVVLQKQSKLKVALEAYTKALSIKPDYANAYNNIGNALQNQGKLDEAIEAFKKALTLKPDSADAYYNMGKTLKKQERLEEAIEAFNKSLYIKPDSAEASNNLGVTLQEQGKLEEAIEAYKIALSIKPDYAETYNNMGNALKNLSKLGEAIAAYKKALSIKPDSADVHHNMGNALQEQGKLEEAIEAYTKALSIKPDHAEAILNASSLTNQISDTTLIDEEFEKLLESHCLELTAMPKYKIQKAIRAFILNDQKLVRKHLKSYGSCNLSSLAKMNAKDQVVCSAYNNFLQKLIETPFENEATISDGQTVFHLGESHCLSYAHKKIKIHGLDHIVTPRITFGGKAYHFSIEKENAFKAITKANFHSLPDSSKVVISFGEIDCRQDEGFIPAAIKLNRKIEDLVSDTIRGYVGWFAKQNQSKNHSLFFLNVPAPNYNEKYISEVNEEVSSTIQLFNSLLHKTVSDCGFNLIDVYKFTVGKGGFSNGLFHIDNRHISSDAIPEIEKQIGTFNN